MKKYKALDLYCGAGGASIGLAQAGFDVIVGIDIKPHKNYPYDFILADALLPPLNLMDFDFVWASPPCQQFSVGLNCKPHIKREEHYPNLIPATRNLLRDHPFTVIENVPQAPIRPDVVLTGKSMGLNRIRRKRHFETSFMMYYPDPIIETREEAYAYNFITVTKATSSNASTRKRRKALGFPEAARLKEKLEAMNIPAEYNMTHAEVGESVPPAYSRYIAEEAIRQMPKKESHANQTGQQTN